MAITDNNARKAFAITPDTVILADALLIGVAGDVALTTTGGDTITLPLPAGYNPIGVTKVFSVGTTATGIFGLRK
jgi:hypothetical protein